MVPAFPRMMGAISQKPEVSAQGKIQPLQRYGLKLMSIGFLIEEGSAVVWRGPMLFKVLEQFLRDVEWGELDYLVIDLPPGTGDIQLSLSQKLPLSGAVIVPPPQNFAFFFSPKPPIFGIQGKSSFFFDMENMSYIPTPNGERIQLFPKGVFFSF